MSSFQIMNSVKLSPNWQYITSKSEANALETLETHEITGSTGSGWFMNN